MTKLAQILAVEETAKKGAHDVVTRAHHALQKPALLAGLSRTYAPRDEEGVQLPAESTRVQITAREQIDGVRAALTRAWDLAATKDDANTSATADIVVDGVTVVPDVPVTTLLWLEKALTDIRTFVVKLPVLDPAERWEVDPLNGGFRTAEAKTLRTKKVPRVLVKYEATDKHPAQTDVYTEDVPEGEWTTVKFSGALPAREVTATIERVDQLLAAVKSARAVANAIEVTDRKIGDALLEHVFGTQSRPA